MILFQTIILFIVKVKPKDGTPADIKYYSGVNKK